jgi:hypothetical protein
MSKLNKQQKEAVEATLVGDPVTFDPYKTVGSGIIMSRPDMKCELCGAIEETRPYGPRGEEVCFNCGMKDEATTKRQMNRVLFGETEQ